MITSSRQFEAEEAPAPAQQQIPWARPPGHGRPAGNRKSVEKSPSPLDRASENNYSRDFMFKAALTPRCFQRTAAKPRSHPKPKKGARVWRPPEPRRVRRMLGGGSPALKPAVLKNGGVGEGGWMRADGGRSGRRRANVSCPPPPPPGRPPQPGGSQPAPSELKRLPHAAPPQCRRPQRGRSQRRRQPRAPPGPPSAPRQAGKAPGAMALPGSHAAWDGAAASVSNSC